MQQVMRSVRVIPVLNGFICEVGCQTLVFHSIEKVAENLIAYHKDPEAMEQKFRAGAVNPTLGPVDVPQPVPSYRAEEALGAARLRPRDFGNAVTQELP